MLDIRTYGAKSDGSDCQPALARALADATGQDRTVWFPAGIWTFLSAPPPLANSQCLVGEGKSATVLVRTYTSGEFLVLQGNGACIHNLTIWAGSGTSGGIAIHAVASDTLGAGGNHVIEHVWVTSGTDGTWAIPIFLDGAARTIAPAGIRACTLHDVNVFNATVWSMEWWNTVACEWFGGGAYQGAGTTQNIVVGGPLATGNLIHANIPGAATSTVWPGSLRSPVA